MKCIMMILFVLILGSAGCFAQSITEETVLSPSINLVLVVDAEPGIPIGYGYTWKCDVRDVVEGELPDTEISLSTYLTADIYDGYLNYPDSCNALEIAFERLEERPAALSGFRATDGTIWQITVVKSAKDRLPWAIEGNYTVSGLEETHKASGYLRISNNEYVYTSLPEDGIPVALAFPILYAEEPEGNYTIEYYGDIESGTQLSDLADNEILLYINFDSDNEYPDFEESRKKFLIRFDQTSRELCFHSIVSEFETWRVRKGWQE